MAATICPTVLAATPEEYKAQIERIADFATRVHIDLADGVFAPTKTITIDDVWWPGGMRADLHVMHQKPFELYREYISLAPQMVIVHAEADGNFEPFAQLMHRHGIEVGVALLTPTPVSIIQPALDHIDYVLVFSGDLGHFGGQADLSYLEKVRELKRLKPTLEIGWDGGVKDTVARELANNGVDVLNTGGFIQKAENPRAAFDLLQAQVS